MYRLYLKNTEIPIPSGLSSISFKRSRSDFYWGFIYNKLGTADNIQLTFTDELSVKMIRNEYEKNGIRGDITVSLYYFDEQVYSGIIDFTTLEFDNQQCSCTLTDDVAIDDFFANQEVKYGIDTNTEIAVPSITTKGLVTFKVDSEQRYIRPFLEVLHTIPFKASKDESVTDGAISEPTSFNDIRNIYTNTTNETKSLNITGRLKLKARTDNSALIYIKINDTIVSNIRTTTTLTDFIVYIDETITLAPNEGITIKVADTIQTGFSFIYSNECVLLVVEDKQEITRDIDVIKASDVLRQILAKINASLTLNYNITDLYITNGKNLRGASGEINISFAELFDTLNKLYNVRLNIKDNVLDISPKINVTQKTGYILPSEKVNSFVYYPSMDLIHNEIQVGYNEWKSESALSGDEYNDLRTYGTDIKNVGSALDLKINAIAGMYLIDEVREQYELSKSGKGSSNTNDEKLYIFDGIENSTVQGTINKAINITLTPLQIMKRWAYYTAISGNATLKTSEGNIGVSYTLGQSDGGEQKENQSVVSGTKFLSGTSMTIDANMELGVYKAIDETIGFFDEFGNLTQGVIKSITITQTLGEGKAIIEAWKI